MNNFEPAKMREDYEKRHEKMKSIEDLESIRNQENIFFNIRDGLANDIDLCLGYFEEGKTCILATAYNHDKEQCYFWTEVQGIFIDLTSFAQWFKEKVKNGASIMTIGSDMSVFLNEGWPRSLQIQLIRVNRETTGDEGDLFKLGYIDVKKLSWYRRLFKKF